MRSTIAYHRNTDCGNTVIVEVRYFGGSHVEAVMNPLNQRLDDPPLVLERLRSLQVKRDLGHSNGHVEPVRRDTVTCT